MSQQLTIIGGGLAGCEAAWQAAQQGISVKLYEMRPKINTEAHTGGDLAELVCSNSLRGDALNNAVGLLKEELRRLNSLLMEAALATKVPAGGALAVNRQLFSAYIEQKIAAEPLIELIREEIVNIPDGPLIIAAGPLASPALSAAIADLTGSSQLFFHDAIAPIIAADSINYDIAYFASRYGKGDGNDYLNCPFTKDEYLHFYQELKAAELYPLKNFESEKLFSGCMPIEAMAKSGEDTMRFGPLKPVGLPLANGEEPYAVVQLRKENIEASMYNLVGFQNRLKQGEQKRIFRLIPGLEQAEFLRYGQMHRNTYIDSRKLLNQYSALKAAPQIFFAGQISGVEGYVESIASGFVCGLNAANLIKGKEQLSWPKQTAIGSLINYISTDMGHDLQPMNINFGLMPRLEQKIRNKQEKNTAIANRALAALDEFLIEIGREQS